MKNSSLVARRIKTDLKAKYPLLKWSVTSIRSCGYVQVTYCAIDALLHTHLPTYEEIQNYVAKYQRITGYDLGDCPIRANIRKDIPQVDLVCISVPF